MLAQPSEGQEAFYNGWVGLHSVTRIVVTEPGGLFVGIGNDIEGRKNDLNTQTISNINMHLHAAGLKAMSDRGFTSFPNAVSAFYKKTQANNLLSFQMKSLSAIRTAGIEWPFGQLKMLFPYFVQKYKQKLYATIPTIWFFVGCLMNNLIRLENGCNNNIFFNVVHPTTVERYLQGLV